MAESKLWLGIKNGKRVKVLAETEEQAAKISGAEGFKYAYQPDPSRCRIIDTETGEIYPHTNMVCVLGTRYKKCPWVALDRVTAVFLAIERTKTRTAFRAIGVNEYGTLCFHIITEAFKDREEPRKVLEELLEDITGEPNPLGKAKVYEAGGYVRSTKDFYHMIDGRNMLREPSDNTKDNIFIIKGLRVSVT